LLTAARQRIVKPGHRGLAGTSAGAVSTDAAGERGAGTRSQRKTKKHLPHAESGSKFVANERREKANLLEPRFVRRSIY
jgi:hypothetical protein